MNGPSDAGGHWDDAQLAACNVGCPCYGTDEIACKGAGCPWNGAYCFNGPIQAERGTTAVCEGCGAAGGATVSARHVNETAK